MGRRYVIEHCMSALSRINEEQNYRIYLTEILRGIARCVGFNVKKSYLDITKKSKGVESENRSSSEIIESIAAKAERIRKNGLAKSEGEDNP